MNSVPSLPDGSNNPVSNTLGLWTLDNWGTYVFEVNPFSFHF